MSVWIKDDLPIYRCDECNGIAFPIASEKLEKALNEAKPITDKDLTCSGCGQSLIEIRSDDYRLDSCKGCSFIFARPKGEFWENEPDSTKGKYDAVISWLSEIYKDVNASF
jgi:hypothetical protein